MYYLRYLCLFAHSDVQHILSCVFVLFFFVLCNLCSQFLWIINFFLLPLRYSLTFICKHFPVKNIQRDLCCIRMLIMEKLPNIQFVMKIEYKDVYHFSSPC